MSSHSDVSWLTVIKHRQEDISLLTQDGFQFPEAPFEQQAFRKSFERLCKSKRIDSAARLQLHHYLFDSYTYIIDLAQEAIECATSLQDLNAPESLESLICRLAFAALQHAFDDGADIIGFIKLLAELNKPVPPLTDDARRFSQDLKVQSSLQDLFKSYFESLMRVLQLLKEKQYKPNQDWVKDPPFKDLLSEHSKRIEEANVNYDAQINQAAQNEDSAPTVKGKAFLDKASQSKPGIPPVLYEILGKELGKGSFAVVHKVREKTTGAFYACKRIEYANGARHQTTAEDIKKKVLGEIEIMQTLRHHHIVTFATYFEDSKGFYIIIDPVAEYDLRTFFGHCVDGKFDESVTKFLDRWFGCLLNALAFTHRKKIRHRDIAPKNILIAHNIVYFCDFGLAKDFSGDGASATMGQKAEGTLDYRAPENVDDGVRGRAADVFSLGCVFFEMFMIRQRHSAAKLREEREKKPFRDCLPQMKNKLRQLEVKGSHRELCHVISGMLDEDPKERYTAPEALGKLRPNQGLFCRDCSLFDERSPDDKRGV